MASEASQVSCGDAGAPGQAAASSLSVALTLLVKTAQPGERWTLWVKRTDVAGAQYVAVKGVDLLQTVDDFKARWVSEEKLDVRPSLVSLRLVPCAPGDDPSEEQELAATALSPRRTLREAGIVDGSSLLAAVVSTRAGACTGKALAAAFACCCS
jgi:hypothetical protein